MKFSLYLRHLVVFNILWLCTGNLHKVYAQFEDFPILPDSEIIHLEYFFDAVYANFRVLSMPDDVRFSRMIVESNSGKCYGGSSLVDLNADNSNLIRIPLNDDCKYYYNDTFRVSIIPMYSNQLYYPSVTIIFGEDNRELRLGADCYKLICYPKNDPWMPVDEDPFLFLKNGYYLEPATGRIRKGKHVANSGLFSACEVKDWYLIYAGAVYTDRHQVSHTGKELIRRRWIRMKNWDPKVFE